MKLAALAALILSGCVAAPRSEYVPTSEPGASSAAPRPHDVRIAVDALLESMFTEWDFASRHPGKIPVIMFTGLDNQTVYPWNEREIIGWIEQGVVRTRMATFSNALDPERAGGRSGHQFRIIDAVDDSDYFDRSTAAQRGRIYLPDYELFGTIHSYDEIRTRAGATEVNYVFEMRLSDIERGISVWTKMVPIRKNIR